MINFLDALIITPIKCWFADRKKQRYALEEMELSEQRKRMALAEVELEKDLDRVGRAKVFALMSRYGWTSNNPAPMWVWRAAIHEIDRSTLKSQLSDPLNALGSEE